MTKSEVESTILQWIESNLYAQQVEMDELLFAMSSDTKSTAGDKHETGRAIAQLEQEKLGKQISDLQIQKQQFLSLKSASKHSTPIVEVGSLIETSIGWFYLGLPLGQLKIGTTTVFCMSVVAPLGKELLHKGSGTEFLFNGKTIQLLSIH